MKLATWNVNSLKMRLPRVLEFLAEHRPHVLCMQETKCTSAAFPEQAFISVGYRAAHHSGGGWAGVAILARADLPIESIAHGLPGEVVPEEARWVEANVAGLRVCSVYVPNGRVVGTPPFEQKLIFLDAMGRRIEVLRQSGFLAVLGDFNVAPSDLDVYDPVAFIGSTHVTAEERGRIAALLDLGLVDAYRRLHPTEVGFTWWDYRQGHFHRGLGLRIDLALLSAQLAQSLIGCGIDRKYRKGAKPSDHAPLIAELTGIPQQP